ncbi:protein adenylyltransferase SelO [Arsenicicoccus dermatophilus]|uniref:protein adenylyltransferase SelO n=1 Tax=Arsenicicoccus dermatophilus TaxID=1076331 RepID=UPI003917046F
MSHAIGPFRLEHSYAEAVPELALAWRAAPAPDPELLVLDEDLCAELGADPDELRTPQGVRLLLGQVPEQIPTYAQAYAGHQFGGWSPRLGDGRALLLGEVVDRAGQRRDLHLKGSGRTPFSRGGDGRAAVGPMLREHLMGVAMHALGIPTTRALAVVATGETVVRQTPLPGAVLVRTAASHLRVGTFQLVASAASPQILQRLTAYAIQRHHPQAAEADDPALALLDAVVTVQAELVARWMQVGFIHGVMNTDNVTISGETIDYGPCAFVESPDPATVFSSIDTGGRYAYGNQPAAALWDLARFAETLLPLIRVRGTAGTGDAQPDEAVARVTEVLERFHERYDDALVRGWADKLGLVEPDRELVTDALELLRTQAVDLTSFCRRLARDEARELFADPGPYDAWATRRARLVGPDPGATAARMDAVNPAYVPRNHVVEAALEAATGGDLAPYDRLVTALRKPFEERPDLGDLASPAPAGSAPHVTFCGT